MAMLSREDHSLPTPAPSAPEMFLGPSVRFEGKLTFKGTVRVDTAFKGTITTNDVLVVGERAVLEANVSCGSVIVSGTVTGNIEAKTTVELTATARVKGDVETPSLVVQKGALFSGGVTMKPAGERNAAVRPSTGAPAGALAPS
jgi:cytoskeletal protein CcmA (bactofilin family)